MKTCWIVTKDHQNELEFREMRVPQPKAGEIVIRVHASALNRGEIFVGGVVHGGPEKLGGNEASGVVYAVGDGVTGIKVGDAVFGRVRGGFAEYALMDAHQIMRKPERLSWEQAAAVPVSYITAWEMIYQYGKLKAGESLLVMGASSGAGVASIQLAKVIGARTIGTSGSQQKLDRLKAIGLDVGIATRKPDFAEAVKQATDGRGVDLVINGVGGSVFAECLRTLAFRGRLATVGYVDNVFKAEIDLSAVHAGRLEIFGVSNARLPASGKAEATAGFIRDVLPALNDGRIVPVVDRVYGFDELPAAKECMESSAMVGKIVVRIG
ncbi:MAG: Alcohol dehydrogenase, zinc-binding protein [Proteobacteria bacterium]|nr:Alcohol dehydrogenase, zinc-binding protein [Pseudomonadota bacterium]